LRQKTQILTYFDQKIFFAVLATFGLGLAAHSLRAEKYFLNEINMVISYDDFSRLMEMV